MQKIKLIWDFRGEASAKTAEHHVIHLKEFAEREHIEFTEIEIEFSKPSFLQIDNVFYEARGTSWALLHFLKAVEVDFADVLQRKNAIASLQQIIRELEMSQQPVKTPVIVNGEGFGLLANHSLVMASYISRANAAIIDLRELLSQG